MLLHRFLFCALGCLCSSVFRSHVLRTRRQSVQTPGWDLQTGCAFARSGWANGDCGGEGGDCFLGRKNVLYYVFAEINHVFQYLPVFYDGVVVVGRKEIGHGV